LTAHLGDLHATGALVVSAGDYNIVPKDLDIYPTKSWDRGDRRRRQLSAGHTLRRPSDDLADFYLEAEHVVQRDTFRGFGITAADRLKHKGLFLHDLIEPRHQRREAPHRDVKNPKREIVVVVERVEEVRILGTQPMTAAAFWLR
jgi:hypothetical protein